MHAELEAERQHEAGLAEQMRGDVLCCISMKNGTAPSTPTAALDQQQVAPADTVGEPAEEQRYRRDRSMLMEVTLKVSAGEAPSTRCSQSAM